jgi:hypothetical protein
VRLISGTNFGKPRPRRTCRSAHSANPKSAKTESKITNFWLVRTASIRLRSTKLPSNLHCVEGSGNCEAASPDCKCKRNARCRENADEDDPFVAIHLVRKATECRSFGIGVKYCSETVNTGEISGFTNRNGADPPHERQATHHSPGEFCREGANPRRVHRGRRTVPRSL